MQVMVIEDDAELGAFIEGALREAGWGVALYPSPKDALLTLAGGGFDALVLDRMLPDMDGVSALKLLRGTGVELPVLMLTAMGGIEDRVAGLEAGADDYLVKPFAMSELIARLRALMRRRAPTAEIAERIVADLVLDRLKRVATRGGIELDLSPLEFKLLDVLMAQPGEIVTRTMLLEKVWGYSFDPKTSLVQTHMSRLRAKVDRPFDTELIRTHRGSGYMIDG